MPRKNKRPPAARQAKPDLAANLAALKRLLARPDVQKYLRLIKRLPKNLEIVRHRKQWRIVFYASGTTVGIGGASAGGEAEKEKRKPGRLLKSHTSTKLSIKCFLSVKRSLESFGLWRRS